MLAWQPMHMYMFWWAGPAKNVDDVRDCLGERSLLLVTQTR